MERNTAFLVEIETEKRADKHTAYHISLGHCHDHCQDHCNPHDHHRVKIGQGHLVTVSAKPFWKVAGRLEKVEMLRQEYFHKDALCLLTFSFGPL